MAGAPKGNKNAAGNKGGAPRGNKNAVGNKSGAPKGNEYALKRGKYRKYVSKTALEIMDDFKKKGATPMDIMKENIYLAQGELVYRMSLMSTEEKKRLKSQGKGITEYEYTTEHEQNIDNMREFANLTNKIAKMIKEYESLAGEKYQLEVEEKKVKIKELKSKVNNTHGNASANSTKKLDSILTQLEDQDQDNE